MSLCLKRQSIRNFNQDPIDDEIIEKLLKSAMQAPSARNQQPWEFYVIKNRDVLHQLAQVSNGARHLEKAPLAILTLMQEDTPAPLMCSQDLSAATQNILLEATNLGLGSLWIGLYPIEERIENVKNTIDLKDSLTPFSLIALGYPSSPHKDKPLRYDASRVTVIE